MEPGVARASIPMEPALHGYGGGTKAVPEGSGNHAPQSGGDTKGSRHWKIFTEGFARGSKSFFYASMKCSCYRRFVC